MYTLQSFKIVPLEERIVLDASIIYVDASVTSGDGNSWGTAYSNLDSALAEAALSTGADQIWIADGTYLPSGGTPNSSFVLTSDVTLYGGFKGNETNVNQRHPLLYRTILSGDYLNNDLALTDPLNAGFTASKADNAHHVLTASGVNAILDGLTVKKGYAYGPDPMDNRGGGLSANLGSDIILNNVIFDQNSALNDGGGVALFDSGSTLIVKNSIFQKNSVLVPFNMITGDGGGAIAVVNDAFLKVTASIFKDNTSSIGHGTGIDHSQSLGHDGGAILFKGSNGEISNTLFLGNHALSGGAITVLPFSETSAHYLIIDSSIFIDNSAEHVGGAIEAIEVPNPGSYVKITNTLFHNNEAVLAGGALAIDSYNAQIDNSNFTSNFTGGVGGAIFNGGLYDALNTLFGSPSSHTLIINNSKFTNNTVVGDPLTETHLESINPGLDIQLTLGGAAVANVANATTKIYDSKFTNNQALNSEGGAILNGSLNGNLFGFLQLNIYGGTLIVERSSFVNNNTTGNGGAIYSFSQLPLGSPNDPIVNVVDSSFVANDAHKGGAVYLERTIATIEGNVFKHSNNATIYGDQIYAADSIVNGVHTSNSSLVVTMLKLTNTFIKLDSDDLYIV